MDDCTCIMPDPEGDRARCHHAAQVRARKAHRCSECGAPIAAGERHEKVSAIWDGRIGWETIRTCLPCADIRDTLFCDGWIHGQIWDDLRGAEVVSAERAPSACILRELTPAGAEKLKRAWQAQAKLDARAG